MGIYVEPMGLSFLFCFFSPPIYISINMEPYNRCVLFFRLSKNTIQSSPFVMASSTSTPMYSVVSCQNSGCGARLKVKMGHKFCVPHAPCMQWDEDDIYDPSMCDVCNKVITQLQQWDNFDLKHAAARPIL